MAVRTYSADVRLSPHFRASEFRCKCGCGQIRIDTNLVETLENLFDALDLSKINVISGYRCAKHDKAVGGRGTGSHVEGYAADVRCFYKDGTRVPSSVAALTLERMGHRCGIGFRCGKTVDSAGNIHIDTKPRKWYGDESRSMTATACGSFFDYLNPFFAVVTEKGGLNIREGSPTGKVVGTYDEGTLVVVMYTNSAHTWGKTADGWICIKERYVRIGRQ